MLLSHFYQKASTRGHRLNHFSVLFLDYSMYFTVMTTMDIWLFLSQWQYPYLKDRKYNISLGCHIKSTLFRMLLFHNVIS